MTLSPRQTLLAGLALILAANIVVLAGAAYNRSGGPEATLRLSERELAIPYSWGKGGEKSAIALDLTWRVLPPVEEGSRRRYSSYGVSGGVARWLSAAKLAELGFSVPADAKDEALERFARREQEREAVLVLEFDGEAYQEAVRAARADLAEAQAELARADASKTLTEIVANASKALERELKSSSRVFVVDAGLDARALRARYPDRTRYAIAAGRVRPWVSGAQGKRRIRGYVSALSVEHISVPYELRRVFTTLEPTKTYGQDAFAVRFEATLAYGRRFEPWLEQASPLAR
jgi:Domain of unknown function (DUF4824)